MRRRLRELRTAQGLTLAQVAERAAIDVSTLSRLESGRRRLALDHVPALAEALGVATDHLLGPELVIDPRVRARPERHPGMTLWALSRGGPGGARAYRVRVAPSRRRAPEPLPTHAGHNWIYVLEGRMRLVLGELDLTIAPGEVVEYSTWTPHWFGVVDEPVELILISGPEGQSEHRHG